MTGSTEPIGTGPVADPGSGPGPAGPQSKPEPNALGQAESPGGWRPPGPGDGVQRGGCTVVAIVVAVLALFSLLPLAAVIALVFLGGQIEGILGGTVQFGTGGSGCTVTGVDESFSASTPIHYAAHFERQVETGETITLFVTFPDGTTDSVDTQPGESTCLYDDIAPGLDAGSYELKFLSGDELLSEGGFEITP